MADKDERTLRLLNLASQSGQSPLSTYFVPSTDSNQVVDETRWVIGYAVLIGLVEETDHVGVVTIGDDPRIWYYSW